MFTPLVSIVLESYNDAQNALAPPADTMNALLSQDFPLQQTELILAGSPAQIEIWRGMEATWDRFGLVTIVPVHARESHYWQLKNQGATIARGELLAFIDCDAVPGPRWLRSLTEALQQGADVSVGPSQYRTSRCGPNSPLMLAAALPSWAFNLSRKSTPGLPVAAALLAHNFGIRRELLLRHPFPLTERSFGSSLLFFELQRSGARFSYRPEQRVAHGLEPWWWLSRAHFRRGWESYEGRAADAAWPRLKALERWKLLEPPILRMGMTMRDARHWFRYANVVGLGPVRSAVIFPLAVAVAGLAHIGEMVGMYSWLFARQATSHQARF